MIPRLLVLISLFYLASSQKGPMRYGEKRKPKQCHFGKHHRELKRLRKLDENLFFIGGLSGSVKKIWLKYDSYGSPPWTWTPFARFEVIGNPWIAVNLQYVPAGMKMTNIGGAIFVDSTRPGAEVQKILRYLSFRRPDPADFVCDESFPLVLERSTWSCIASLYK